MRHKWFRGVDWEAILEKRIPTPWIPLVKDPYDVQWFDKYPESK
jgi:protein kinase A